MENLQELDPATRLVSVVLGKSSHCGRLWLRPHEARPLGRQVVVGERLVYRCLDGQAEGPPPPPSAVFDRGLALTGAGAMGILSSLTVAVIGASGTGSLVCELLARAGCQRILLIDDDVIKDINLNRILYATRRMPTGKPQRWRCCARNRGAGPWMPGRTRAGNVLDREVLVPAAQG